MLSKYIKELIPNNSRIIIPDFGAFMIQDTPKGKVISFNDFLKFNDSVLLNRIITAEKVDSAKGKEEIKAYIAEIEAAFKAGESFAVEGVGYLSKDGQNNINFEQDENAKSKGKAKTTAKPKAEPKAEAVKPAAEPKAEPKAEAPKAEAPKAPAAEPAPQPAAAPKPQPSVSQQTSTQKTNTYINNNYSNNNMEVKTKDKTLTTVLIIVAALVIVGVLIWLAIDFNWFGPFKKAKEAPAPVEVIDTTPAIDTTAVDTLEVVEPEPIVVEEPVVDPSSKHYHLIAGSFQVESNAIRFQEDMRSRGYDAVILTRGTGYHYVSIKAFDTRSEAVSEWRNMTLENPNLWILIK